VSAAVTLRDYFIAHAPAEPQPWFQPVMPQQRPVPPNRFEIQDEATKEDVCVAWACDSDPTTDAGIEWTRLYNQAVEAANAWDAEKKKQRYLQWPSAWANEQLRLRGGVA
jgi:hypothetical protein